MVVHVRACIRQKCMDLAKMSPTHCEKRVICLWLDVVVLTQWYTYPMMQERKKLNRKPTSHHPGNSYAWEERQGTGDWRMEK